MGLLPTARNTNYGANSPVKSADLDDLQDCIIAGKHGLMTLNMHGSAFAPSQNLGTWSIDNQGAEWSNGGRATASITIPKGSTLKAVRIYCKDGATPTVMTANVYVVDNTGGGAGPTITALGAGAASNGTGTRQTLALAFPATVLGAGQSFVILVTTGAADQVIIYGAEADYEVL